MLPSEELREYISRKIGTDLSKFSWTDKFIQFVYTIKLDELYETKVHYLDEVYKLGLNIGHCGLTSRYLVMNIPYTDLYYGKFPPLAGTKNSHNGNHAWAVCGDILLDTTLMLALKVEKAKELGYVFERQIDRNSAKILSEYELYSNEYENYLKDEKAFRKTLIPR